MQFTRSGKKHNKISTFGIVLGVILIIYTISIFVLLYWALITSFKDRFDYDLGNKGFGLPEKFCIDVYKFLFTDYHISVTSSSGVAKNVGFMEMIHNSFVYAIGASFFQTLVPCLTAYVCARYKFKFLKIYYLIVIVTMVIPVVGSTASELQMAMNFGLYEQLWGIWIMKANFLGLYFLIFHATFKNLPDAYSEAAKIDGASNFSIMVRIMLPLVRNTFMTIILINFVNYWNDYQTPLLFFSNHPTVFYGIYYATSTSGGGMMQYSSTPAVLSFAVLGLIPTATLFICFHKKLLGSLSVGGIK